VPRLRNTRGAVILLSTYFVSLSLLLLSTVMLQRVMTELRASEVSRDQQQAFYLAEGALDQAVVTLGTEAVVPEQTDQVISTPWGDATFRVSTETADVLGGFDVASSRQQFLKRIEATGTRGHGTATVASQFLEEGPLSGIWSNAVIIIQGPGYTGFVLPGETAELEPITLVSDLHSNLGVASSIRVIGGVVVDGDVHVGPPRDSDEEFESAEFREAYRQVLGSEESTDGVVVASEIESTVVAGKLTASIPASDISGRVSATTSVGQILPITNPWAGAPNAATACGTPINMNPYVGSQEVEREVTVSGKLGAFTQMQTFTELIIEDNAPWWKLGAFSYHFFDGNSLPDSTGDFSWSTETNEFGTAAIGAYPTSTDHQLPVVVPSAYQPRDLDGTDALTFCTPYVDMPGGDLIFHGRTQLYLTGSTVPPDDSSSPYAFRVPGNVLAVDREGNPIPDGVHVIVTDVDSARAGRVDIGGSFSGSVFAPQSTVLIRSAGQDGLVLGSLVGRELILVLKDRTEITGPPDEGEPLVMDEGNPLSLLNWMNGDTVAVPAASITPASSQPE